MLVAFHEVVLEKKFLFLSRLQGVSRNYEQSSLSCLDTSIIEPNVWKIPRSVE